MTKDTRPTTPFVQTPTWLFEVAENATDHITWMAIAKFCNDDRQAFPSRATLARLVKVSVDTIDRAIARLVRAGALTVQRRTSRIGRKISNLYTLVWDDPRRATETTDAPAGVGRTAAASDAAPVRHRTRSTVTTPTIDPRSTPERPVARSLSERAPRTPNPGGLPPTTRKRMIRALQHVGQLLAAGHHWNDPTVQDAADTFTTTTVEHFPDLDDILTNGKWSCTAAVADPYQAGVKLNKLIHTAHTGGIHPAA